MTTEPIAIMGVRSAAGRGLWAACVPVHPVHLELLQCIVLLLDLAKGEVRSPVMVF